MASIELAARDVARNDATDLGPPGQPIPKSASIALAAKLANTTQPPAPTQPPSLLQRIGSEAEDIGGAIKTAGETGLEGLEQGAMGIGRAGINTLQWIGQHPMASQAITALTPAAGAALPVSAALGRPDVQHALEGTAAYQNAMIRQSQDVSAAQGQQYPFAGFAGQFVGQNLPSALVGSGVTKLGESVLPMTENKLVNFMRKRLIDSVSGGSVGAAQPTGPGGTTQAGAGALFGALGGTAMDAASRYAPEVVSRAATMVNGTARRLYAGAKLAALMAGKPLGEASDLAGMQLSLGEMSGNPELLAAEAAVKGHPLGAAAVMERLSQNNVALRTNLQRLTGSMLSDSPSEGIQKAAQGIRDTLDSLEGAESANETNLWNDFRENNPGIGFHVPSVLKGIKAYIQDNVEPEFQLEIAPMMKQFNDRIEAAQNFHGDVVPFSTLKNLRTIVMNHVRPMEDGNFKRVGGAISSFLTDYVTNPNNLVTEGNLPITADLLKRKMVMDDFDKARLATKNYWSNWGDNALADFISKRGENYQQGLGQAGQLLSPDHPDLTDYTLKALSRTSNGLPQAQKWFGYQLLKKTEQNATDANGDPTISPSRAYGWLTQNMSTAKRIFNTPEQHALLDSLTDFFGRARRIAQPGLSRDAKDEMLKRLSLDSKSWADKILIRHYLGEGSTYGRLSGGQLLNAIPEDKYPRMIVDALNDPEFAQQLARNASSSPTLKLLMKVQKYAPPAVTGMIAGKAVRALPPNQGQQQ